MHNHDAGMREVFRGDLSAIELAAGVLEENGIEYQRRWEQAGGTAFTIGDTALVPGRTAVLLVPTIVFAEAQEVLAGFHEPEPEYLTELSDAVNSNRHRRRTLAKIVAALMLLPIAVWFVGLIFAFFSGFLG